jgi:hypothetical protein
MVPATIGDSPRPETAWFPWRRAPRRRRPPRLRAARHARGPLLVKLLAGWLHHDGRYVAWDRVRAIEPDPVHISGSADDLPQPDASQ